MRLQAGYLGHALPPEAAEFQLRCEMSTLRYDLESDQVRHVFLQSVCLDSGEAGLGMDDCEEDGGRCPARPDTHVGRPQALGPVAVGMLAQALERVSLALESLALALVKLAVVLLAAG